MDWQKFSKAIFPIVIILVLATVGIICIFLGARYPEQEWIKNIAFLIFGTTNGPIYNVIQYMKGNETTIKKVASMVIIGGLLGLSLSFIACGGNQGVNNDCMINAGVKCYQETMKCFESDTSTDPELE